MRRCAQPRGQQIESAIVIEVGHCRAARHLFAEKSITCLQSHFLKFSVQVVKQQVALGVAHAKGFLVHLGIHMPIGDKNIRPAVVVVIEKFQPKAEKRNAHGAESGSRLLVGEFAGAVVVIEIVGVVGKIGLG